MTPPPQSQNTPSQHHHRLTSSHNAPSIARHGLAREMFERSVDAEQVFTEARRALTYKPIRSLPTSH